MKQLFSLLIGLVALITLVLKRSEDRKNEREALKKEVYDAIENSDVSRINALIQYINRM